MRSPVTIIMIIDNGDGNNSKDCLQCRYLWRGKHTFAIAQHKHHRSIYEEADSNKRRKRYARPLIDLHMKIYYYEGMKPWNPMKRTISGKIWIQDFFILYFVVLLQFHLSFLDENP